MRHTIPLLALALSLPFAAHAAERCEFSAPRNLQLDLTGVKAVVFDIGPDELSVTGSPGAKAAVSGRACATNAADLPGMTVTQKRVGDKLVVVAQHRSNINFGLNRYSYMKLQATVPDTMMVQLKVGSGDVDVDRVASLSADVGSGDIKVSNVRGLATADVGSGDVDFQDIGSLQVISLGSGDLTAKRIARDAKLGSIGSGDVELSNVGGSVELSRIGSGDLEVNGVRGDLRVHSIGSGSVVHNGVAGRVQLPQND
ncbi:hypothetical protein [Lysobacter sp. CA196]|uniref:hypothetical protein n=1 Tax=Lysobacter sp. CA196 TaxID=3455606 RepID=UPI003F8D141A